MFMKIVTKKHRNPVTKDPRQKDEIFKLLALQIQSLTYITQINEISYTFATIRYTYRKKVLPYSRILIL